MPIILDLWIFIIRDAHLSLDQIDILVLIGVRADELTVELRTGGVDAARSRGDDFLALGQIKIRRRQDLAPGQPDDQQEAGQDRRRPHPASSRKSSVSSYELLREIPPLFFLPLHFRLPSTLSVSLPLYLAPSLFLSRSFSHERDDDGWCLRAFSVPTVWSGVHPAGDLSDEELGGGGMDQWSSSRNSESPSGFVELQHPTGRVFILFRR